jgi:hypothetical protein
MRRTFKWFVTWQGLPLCSWIWFGEHYYYYYYYYLTSFATHDGKVKPQSPPPPPHTHTHTDMRTCWNSPWPYYPTSPGPPILTRSPNPFFFTEWAVRQNVRKQSEHNSWELQTPDYLLFTAVNRSSFCLAILEQPNKILRKQKSKKKSIKLTVRIKSGEFFN